ncbi:MAG: hypothetical protein DRQ44_10355 [Gammaproteobacteria bacterium]|nr:MAG: hypothetical protein DRQ44_10355 [Gammaproteobacteria bacterium]
MNAEEKTTEDELTNDQTTQPLLIDSDPEAGIEAETTENKTDEEIITKDALIENSINETTPQPPLIDAQPQPSYGPETTDSVTEQETSPEDTQSNEKTIEPTPQPPLIDAQPQPSYGPETTDNTTEQETSQEDAQSNEQTIEPTRQPPLIDAQPEPVNEPESVDSTAEEEKDTSTNEQTITDSTIDDDSDIELKEQPEEQEAEKAKEQSTKWSDTRPQRVNADWLQITSGEWIRGRIIAMQKEDLEFDSDELDKLVIEWKKVKYIKSSDPYRLRFDDNIQAIGAIEITQQEVHVITDYDDKVFERSKLLTIASGKETEISYWTSKITFSINVRRGNTDQTDFTSKINAKRQTIISRVTLDYLGNFTEVEETETINNHRINATYDIFITRDIFITPITAEYFRDSFQNIDRRIYVGAAIGYSLINTNKTEWDISGGPAYQSTKFVSVQPDQSPEDNALTLILSTKFDTELNDKVDLNGTYSATLGDETTGNYSHHSILTVETEITDKLDFDVSLVWDRVKSPVPDENNVTPEQDDFRLMIGLGYDL